MEDPPARRRAFFGSVAARYAEHRPGYPDQAVTWTLNSLPINGQILGVVAGTGKLTDAVLPCGVPAAAALAVEPDDEMRAQLSRLYPRLGSVLGRQSGPLRVRGGRRRPGWAGMSLVRLTGSTHGFDADRALGEIARTMQPGGVLAA